MSCLVPRPHYYARPMRFGSRGPKCIDREGLERRRTGTRQVYVVVSNPFFKLYPILCSQTHQAIQCTSPYSKVLKRAVEMFGVFYKFCLCFRCKQLWSCLLNKELKTFKFRQIHKNPVLRL